MHKLDQVLVNKFYTYYENYYGSDYRPNQGLDELTDLIAKYSVKGNWIDLGGGTSSIIWLPAFNHLSEILVCDKYRESFYVQQEVRKRKPSGCYNHVLARYNKSEEQMNDIPMNFLQIDLLSDFSISGKYDNVTQFGLLGLCNSKQHYYHQLNLLARLIKPQGIFIGANWILSKKHSKERHINNSYIKKGIITDWTIANNKIILEETVVPIQNDPDYDAVLIYAFR